MELHWLLDDNDFYVLKKKRIICFERDISSITEMISQHSWIADRLERFIDNNPKTHGIWNLGGKDYPVSGVEFFESLSENDAEKYAVVITSTYYREIYEQLKSLSTVSGRFDVIYVYAFKRLKKELLYREKFNSCDLENIILFRSGPIETSYVKGMDYADNARALFEYMLEHDYDKQYKLVWLVKDPSAFEKGFIGRNVEAIAYDWATIDDVSLNEKYYHDLFLAKFIFMTDAYGFAGNCRKDQIRIQLWHGCGFKTRVNFSSCENRYEYNIVVSDVYKKIHAKIYGLRDDQVVITGYPKQDWLRKPYKKSVQELLGINSGPEKESVKKTIFWLPTFRMANEKLTELNQYNLSTETSLPIVSTYEQLWQLNEILHEANILLVIKFHPFIKKDNIKRFSYSNIIGVANDDLVDKDLVINRLLAGADALISDYSSAAVDYLSLDRPIAFTLDDMEEYQNSRGFVFDNIKDWLPGKEILTFDDFIAFVREIGSDIDSSYGKRHEIGSKMNRFRDDKNCERVINWLHI